MEVRWGTGALSRRQYLGEGEVEDVRPVDLGDDVAGLQGRAEPRVPEAPDHRLLPPRAPAPHAEARPPLAPAQRHRDQLGGVGPGRGGAGGLGEGLRGVVGGAAVEATGGLQGRGGVGGLLGGAGEGGAGEVPV